MSEKIQVVRADDGFSRWAFWSSENYHGSTYGFGEVIRSLKLRKIVGFKIHHSFKFLPLWVRFIFPVAAIVGFISCFAALMLGVGMLGLIPLILALPSLIQVSAFLASASAPYVNVESAYEAQLLKNPKFAALIAPKLLENEWHFRKFIPTISHILRASAFINESYKLEIENFLKNVIENFPKDVESADRIGKMLTELESKVSYLRNVSDLNKDEVPAKIVVNFERVNEMIEDEIELTVNEASKWETRRTITVTKTNR